LATVSLEQPGRRPLWPAAWYGASVGLGASGTPANADWSAEGNQAGARFGLAAGTAGDVNHDQYIIPERSGVDDDVIVGADKYDSGQTTNIVQRGGLFPPIKWQAAGS